MQYLHARLRRLLPSLLLCALVATLPTITAAQSKNKVPAPPFTDAMRGSTAIDQETHPPLIPPTENKDQRRQRNYAMQPPTIPHTIDGYQVDKDFNRCMFCHARTAVEVSGAIPVSVTHYMDREGNVLADVSPRRYFCNQCHVPQAEAKPLVDNTFVDVEKLLQRTPGVPGSKK